MGIDEVLIFNPSLAVADQNYLKYLKRSTRCQESYRVSTEPTLCLANKAPKLVTLAAYNTHPDWMDLKVSETIYETLFVYMEL